MGMFVVAPATSFLHHHHHHLLHGGYFHHQNHPNSATFDGSQNLFHLHSGGGGGSGGASTCQDCGNQSKKDCVHRRCRTCCKSRGLDCATHVKSTWVPAARRRERLQQAAAHSTGSAAVVTASCSQSGSYSGAKKPRLGLGGANTNNNSQTSTSNNTARSFDTGESGGGSMPKQITAPAEFRCVRVSPVDGGDDAEYAYQAVVRIGGHVFKGFLYDQGLDNHRYDDDHTGKVIGCSSVLFPNMSDLHLGGGGRSGGGGGGGNHDVILGGSVAAMSSQQSHDDDVYGAATSAAGMIGIGGGSSFGIGNLFPG